MGRVFRAFTIGLVAVAVFSLRGDSPHAQGLVPVLVKDINGTTTTLTPSNLTAAGSLLFYTASDATNGMELWKSDGTVSGTVLVKDIWPGSSGSGVSNLTNVNGTLFFTASDPTNSFELWKSDGSAAGTTLVKDVVPGSGSGSFSYLTNVNGTLFFVHDDGGSSRGAEVWKSDGTAAGTVLVKDIAPGSQGSFPIYLTNVNGTVFFSALTSANGYELWKTDGTAAGTVLVKDIIAGTGSGDPQVLTNVNGTLFFTANQSGTGSELWKSDGTAAGTVLVKDIALGPTSSSAFSFVNVNGTVFFSADDAVNGRELWKSDGTAAGTVLVKDIFLGFAASTPGSLTNLNGTLFFNANDGTTGQELWKSDGTIGGTVRVSDIFAGSASSTPNILTNVNGTLFFRANSLNAGVELWKTDGSAGSTVLVKDIRAGDSSSNPTEFVNLNGTLFLSATDGVNGQELWRSDGTASGTVAILQSARATASSSPNQFTNLGGVTYFAASDGISGGELWKTDGTAAGTVIVKDINPGGGSSSASSLVNVNGTLFFGATDGTTGFELWKSDGTAAGTVLLKDLNPGNGTSSIGSLTNVNGTLFFRALDGGNGQELWKSDGTTAGTVVVKDILPGANNSSSPQSLTNVNGTLFFTATDGVNGTELWKSDGTAAGTVLVKDIVAGSSGSNPQQLVNINGTLFFRPSQEAAGQELWRSDGTAAGTFIVKDINPGSASSLLTFANVNGTVFLSATDPTNGTELWKSDGTAAGTVLVKDIAPGASSSSPNLFASVGGTLFFRANDGVNGNELWKSDGTAAGTVMVKDIWAGSSSSNPSSLANINGTVYFSANDGINGVELWQSDGTAAGTVMVGDIYAGSGNANPVNMTAIGSALFFTATDFAHGAELWTLGKSDQTITVTTPAPSTAAYNSEFMVMALASSGLGVAITAGPAGVCSITSGGTMTATVHMSSGSGTCTVHYNQPGNSFYNAGPELTDTVTATGGSQTIAFGALVDRSYGAADFAVSATASSGLQVTFSTQTPTRCTVAASTVHIVAAGGCTVTASQVGDASYAPAPDVDRSFTINPASLTVKADDKTKPYDGGVYSPFTATLSGFVNGETDSGLRGTGALSGTPGFTGAATTAINVGSYTLTPTVGTLTATNYTFSTFTDGALTIGTAGQTIAITTAAPSTAAFSATFNVAATSTSGLDVAITAAPPTVCSISSGGLGSATVQMVSGTGACTVHYNQPGNDNYNAALEVTSNTTATKASQTITFGALGDRTYGDADSALVAIASSGLTVSFASDTPTVCAVSGASVHVAAAGACSIRALQGGNDDYDAAGDVVRAFTAQSKTLTASIVGDPTRPYDGSDVATLSAANFSLDGLVGSDSFTVTRTVGAYNSPDVAGASTVSASLAAGDFAAGAATNAANYTLPTTASGPGHITQATSTTTISCPASVGYVGAAQTPCTASVTGNGGLSLTPTPDYTNNVNAGIGTATASFTFAGDDNHSGSSDSKTFSIDKAAVTATAGSGSVTYDGAAHTPSACVVTGAYSGNLSCANAPASVGPDAGITATSAVVSGTGLTNFEVTTVAGSYSIGQAGSTTTVACPASVTYSGAAQTPCSVTVTGAGLNLTPAPSYANNVNAGTGTASASYTYTGDTNHTGSSDSKAFSIDRAAVTATAGSGSTTYDGNAHPPSACNITGAYTGNLTCANAPATVGPDAGTTAINAVVSGSGSTNFEVTSVAGSYVIGQAGSTTTVTCPASVTYNGAAQTPCSVSVTGIGEESLSATPSYANNTNAGINTASASYTYAGDINHTGSSGSKTFSIDKAPVTATAGSGSTTYDGSIHAPSACVVTGPYAGDLSCTNNPASAGPSVGTTTISPVVAGTNQTNFAITLANGSYAIAQATQAALILSVPVSITYGNTGAASASGGSGTGAIAFSAGASTGCAVDGGSGAINVLDASGTCAITASKAGDSNYSGPISDGPKAVMLNKAAQAVVSVISPTSVTYGTTATAVAAGGSGSGAYSFSAVGSTGCSVSGTVVSVSNAIGTCQLTAVRAGDNNYDVSAASVPFTVPLSKAATASTITSDSPDASNTGQAVVVNFTVTSAGGVPSGSVTVSDGVDSCTGTVNAGTCSITMTTSGARTLTATYAGDVNFVTSSDTELHQVNAVSSNYTVAGFFAPIDMSQPSLIVWNSTLSGQSVPVKWRLTQNGGPVSDPNSFLLNPAGLFSYQVNCSTGAGNVEDAIEEYAPGGASLSYKGDGNWQYNWQTLKSYKNTCRVMFVKFSDGTVGPAANFKFK